MLSTRAAGGLSATAAANRLRPRPVSRGREELLAAVGKQLRAPTMTLMAGGACVTLLLAQPLNTALISVSLTINVLAGLWQERQVSRGGESVQQLGAPRARVLRDGVPVTVTAAELVPGDVLLLMRGDRVAADARLLSAESLEVGEATLTGESLPVTKGPAEPDDHKCIVLEGSEVVVGSGRAVVVAVGRQTRLGATAAAMDVSADRESPLGARLARRAARDSSGGRDGWRGDNGRRALLRHRRGVGNDRAGCHHHSFDHPGGIARSGWRRAGCGVSSAGAEPCAGSARWAGSKPSAAWMSPAPTRRAR